MAYYRYFQRRARSYGAEIRLISHSKAAVALWSLKQKCSVWFPAKQSRWFSACLRCSWSQRYANYVVSVSLFK